MRRASGGHAAFKKSKAELRRSTQLLGMSGGVVAKMLENKKGQQQKGGKGGGKRGRGGRGALGDDDE